MKREREREEKIKKESEDKGINKKYIIKVGMK